MNGREITNSVDCAFAKYPGKLTEASVASNSEIWRQLPKIALDRIRRLRFQQFS